MAWARLEPRYFRNAKVAQLSQAGKLLDLAGIAFSAAELRDGLLSAHDVRMAAADADVDNLKALLADLARVGRWHQLSPGEAPACDSCRQGLDQYGVAQRAEDFWTTSPGGWLIHDYFVYQPPKQQVEADRAAAAERMRKIRASRHPGPNGHGPNGHSQPRLATVPLEEPARPADKSPRSPERSPEHAAERSAVRAAERAPARAEERADEVREKFGSLVLGIGSGIGSGLRSPGEESPGFQPISISKSAPATRARAPTRTHAHAREDEADFETNIAQTLEEPLEDDGPALEEGDDGWAPWSEETIRPRDIAYRVEEVGEKLADLAEQVGGKPGDDNPELSVTRLVELQREFRLTNVDLDNALKEARDETLKHVRRADPPITNPMGYFLRTARQRAEARAERAHPGRPWRNEEHKRRMAASA
jgi:hypothetical protein